MSDQAMMDHLPVVQLRLGQVRIDGSIQGRVRTDAAHVDRLAEAIKNGADLPPIDVFFDGETYWNADGFHRHPAHEKAGLACINCCIHEGDRRAAMLFAAGANGEHGLPRTAEDKRRAVKMLLMDQEWCTWPHQRIADQCHVSRHLVMDVEREIRESGDDAASCSRLQETTRVIERDGKTQTMNVANIGKPAETKPPPVGRKPGTEDPVPEEERELYNNRKRAMVQHVIWRLDQAIALLSDFRKVKYPELMKAMKTAKGFAEDRMREIPA